MTQKQWPAIILTTLLLACSPVQDQMLVGSWKGVAVFEEGMPLGIEDPSVIKMTFTENQGYQYQSTLNYREAGTYHVASKYLYTTDTLNRASTEKAVEILRLTADSLILKMNEAGRTRKLVMARTD